MYLTVKNVFATGIMTLIIATGVVGVYELNAFRILDISALGVFGIFFNGMILLYIFSIAIFIFLENKNPSKTLAWLMVLFLIPIFGFFMYVIIGGNYSYRLRTKLKRKKMQNRVDRTVMMQKELVDEKYIFSEKDSYISNRLLMLLLNNSNSPFTVNNSVKVLTNGEQTYGEMVHKLENAKNHIHLEYFIIKSDNIGNKIKEILIRKAKEGLEVRVIYDSVGCWRLSKSYIRELVDGGVEVKEFFPVIAPVFSRELNYRNHRKILVVDGEFGFVGGLNIGDEYLGKSEQLGFWRDTHIMIHGEAVFSLQDIFANDWHYLTKDETIFNNELQYYPTFSEVVGTSMMQVTASGPDSDWQSILQAYFTMISTAEERIWIVTPYLVPEESLIMALKTSALSGRDVRIIIPSRMDHFLAFWASRDNIDDLLKAGVKIYSYDNGFIHSKIIMVDGVSASVGTANLDIRSLEINFEVNAFIYDTEVVKRLEKDFMDDIEKSSQFSLEARGKRPKFEKVLESLGRLASPLQ